MMCVCVSNCIKQMYTQTYTVLLSVVVDPKIYLWGYTEVLTPPPAKGRDRLTLLLHKILLRPNNRNVKYSKGLPVPQKHVEE